MNFLYDRSIFACVADTLKLLYRVSANLCTISCSNPTQSQGHMSAFLIGQFLRVKLLCCIRKAKLFYLVLDEDSNKI